MQKTDINLFETVDATIWAKEFVRLHGGDEKLMVTWFSNAIIVGYDSAEKKVDEFRGALAEIAKIATKHVSIEKNTGTG